MRVFFCSVDAFCKGDVEIRYMIFVFLSHFLISFFFFSSINAVIFPLKIRFARSFQFSMSSLFSCSSSNIHTLLMDENVGFCSACNFASSFREF